MYELITNSILMTKLYYFAHDLLGGGTKGLKRAFKQELGDRLNPTSIPPARSVMDWTVHLSKLVNNQEREVKSGLMV